MQVFLLDREHEDEVRPGGVLVHVRHGHGPVEVPCPHGIEDLLLAPDVGFGHLTDEDASRLVLVDLEVVLLGVEEVADTLVVDLDDGDLDEELDVLVSMIDSIEDRPHHARNDTLVELVLDVRSLHGVRLPRRRLPVGEDGAVEAPQHSIDDRLRRIVVDLLLIRIPSEHPVEDEGVVGVRDVHRGFGRDFHADFPVVVPLLLVLRSKPAAHLDALLMGVHVTWPCHLEGQRAQGGRSPHVTRKEPPRVPGAHKGGPRQATW
mmetsp:Transcript_37752/g.112133  ORF Transcript_37752/g.112133 Transcript_37752/m.112133 type:complete len:262 (-) Transcript_37752:45-830(-)